MACGRRRRGLTVDRVAAGLGVPWHTANNAVLAQGRRVLIDVPGRFDGVTTIGVDEHVWRPTRHVNTCVTVIIDLAPVQKAVSVIDTVTSSAWLPMFRIGAVLPGENQRV